ncbi:MAG: SRPBCC family protein [Colwellia sp.]|nr:SRPBCC family protein [Colwellia sp.]
MKVIKSFKYNIIHKIKTWSSLIFTLTLLGCNSMPSSTEKLSVDRTLVINATAVEVWAFAGGWTSLDNLAPAAIASILSNGNEVGSFRKVNLKGGGIVQETMVDKSETSYSYIITKSPLPLSNYRSTIGVKDLGNGNSEFSWKSDFIADGVSDAEAINIIARLYEGAVEVLQNKYADTNTK